MQTVLQRAKNKTYFYKKKINLAEMKHNVGTYNICFLQFQKHILAFE